MIARNGGNPSDGFQQIVQFVHEALACFGTAVHGGSTAVGSVLALSVGNHGVQVGNHGSTQTACFGERHAAAAASTKGDPLGVSVGAASGADCACHVFRLN